MTVISDIARAIVNSLTPFLVDKTPKKDSTERAAAFGQIGMQVAHAMLEKWPGAWLNDIYYDDGQR